MNCTLEESLLHLHVFCCKYFVHNNGKDNLRKFDTKSDEVLFTRYSSLRKVFNVYNKRTLKKEEFIHIMFDKSTSMFKEII